METINLTQELLHEVLDVHPITGQIFFKERPRRMFSSKMKMNAFNNNNAGKEACPGNVAFKLFGKTQQKSRMVWLYYTGMLPDGKAFKILTVNRNRDDTRIENLVCVPNSISCKQRRKASNVNNMTAKVGGIIWREDLGLFDCFYMDLEGYRHTKCFRTFIDAYWWRMSNEPPSHYHQLGLYKDGSVLANDLSFTIMDDGEELPEVNHLKDPEVVAKAAKTYSKLYSGANSFSFKGALVGTNIKTGTVVNILGSKAAEAHGFLPSKIYDCIAGRRKTHKGYTWERQNAKEEA